MAVKRFVNKSGGPKSIIKLSSNNLMHNYMFNVIYKLEKMTSFAISCFNSEPLPMVDWPILVLNCI